MSAVLPSPQSLNLRGFGRMFSGLSPSGRLGLCLVALAFVTSTAIPALMGTSPSAMTGPLLAPPNGQHWLGTDDLGRDVLARVVFGGQVSLFVGVVSASIAVLLGTAVGATAGYVGGKADEAVMRISEAFQIIPRFFLALVVVALLGSGIFKLALIFGILSWPATARVVRAQMLVLRREEFVLAAIMGGASSWRVIARHILPNILPIIVVSASLQAGAAILLESFVSFLGLGDPTHPSWGLLLQQGQLHLRSGWWISAFPGVALSLTILGLNLLGDGLSDSNGAGVQAK
jgi:peptide/nickel transport system permease protein